MPIQPGTRLAAYEVLSLAGTGGMGEVYKARDTRLHRIVALKVLPPELSNDPIARQRLEREARAVAALSHPHICPVFDIGRQEKTDFLVVEYLEGQTLGARLARGKLPVDQALECAVQIADALAAAHKAGMVHRDVKPGNIMLTNGVAKLLDFGLAKPPEPPLVAGQTATMAAEPLTAHGTIMGTLQYMAPEQLEGKAADPRSDIFSLGCVLYEMLTGRRAFAGDSSASVIAGILGRDPPPTAEIESIGGSALDHIVRRTLAKRPDDRFQTARDLQLELKWIAESQPQPTQKTGLLRSQGVPLFAFGVVAVLLAATATAAWWLSRPRSTDAISALARLTSDSGLTWEPALSPDGKLIAYSSDRGTPSATETNLDIWVQQVAGGEPIRLTHDPADDREPTFSPDSFQIAFHSDRDGGGLYVVPALGGEVRLISKHGQTPRFSPDGRSILYWVGNRNTGDPSSPGSAQAYVVATSGGPPRPVHPEFSVIRYPIWAPDGTHLLFWGKMDPKATAAGAVDWWVASLDGDKAVNTGAAAALSGVGLQLPLSAGAWLPNGQVVFAARDGDTSDLWQLPVGPSAGRVTGLPIRLTTGTGMSEQPSIAVARDDRAGRVTRLALSGLARNTQIWSLALDANRGRVTGTLQRLTDGPAAANYGSLSLDGRALVFARARAGEGDVWIKDLQTGREVDLTPTPDRQLLPRIAPDRSMVVYSEMKDGKSSIYTLSIGTAPVAALRRGLPHKLCDDCRWAWDWSRDSSRVFLADGSAGRPEVTVAEVSTGEKTRLFGHPQFSLYQANASPDGRWVAFLAHIDPERSRVFVAPFRPVPVSSSNAIPPDWIPISTGRFWDDKPRWSPDGNLLYFVSNRDRFLCLWAQRLDPSTKQPAGAPFDVLHIHNAGRSMLNVGLAALEPSVARDRIILNLGEITGNVWLGTLERVRR